MLKKLQNRERNEKEMDNEMEAEAIGVKTGVQGTRSKF